MSAIYKMPPKGNVLGKPRGFTLVEILAVVAVLAVLAIAAVVVFNPVESLAQSRDSTRIADMGTMQVAMELYLSDRIGNYDDDVAYDGATKCVLPYHSVVANKRYGYYAAPTGGDATISEETFAKGVQGAAVDETSGSCRETSSSNNRAINGNGWLPVELSAISTGAPFASLPIDPINNGDYVYRANLGGCGVSGCAIQEVTATALYYEIDAKMESGKYSSSKSVAATDGGDKSTCSVSPAVGPLPTCYYEVGNTDNATL